MRQLLVLIILLLSFPDRIAASDPSFEKIERDLTDIIRWEILWGESPRDFRIPSRESARVFIGLSPNNVSYCSHDAGICATYLLSAVRNWQRVKIAKCAGPEDDEKALITFMTGDANGIDSQPLPRKPPIVGPGGLMGVPSANPPTRWAATLHVGSQASILEDYKHLQPIELTSLRNWLLSSHRNSGYASITVSCFKSSDPEVFVYGERVTDSEIIFSVFWNRDQGAWIEAGLLRAPELPKRFEELRSTVKAIPCGDYSIQMSRIASHKRRADQRFYTSQFGRFMSADRFKRAASLYDSGSWNKYSYAVNDPVNSLDPTGQYSCAADDDDDDDWRRRLR